MKITLTLSLNIDTDQDPEAVAKEICNGLPDLGSRFRAKVHSAVEANEWGQSDFILLDDVVP